jgi:predicted ATPase
MAHDVFISYSFDDKAVADAFCAQLEAAGIACWIAPRDPRPGLPYGAQIVQAISQSAVTALVFSRAANASRAVLGEIELGANRGKPIFPMRIDPVEPVEDLEYYIRSLHWFDATQRPIDARLGEAVTALRALLDGVPRDARPDTASRTNLPAQVTSFVGRESEVAEISQMLEAHRLVTLTGSAGIGKTRTTLEAASSVLDAFEDGVWFVELAPLASGEYVAATVAQAAGIALPPRGDALDNLVAAVKARHLLFVFDNCEHLIEAAGVAIAALLRGCPQLKVLASSRQALRIDGEQTYRLPPLNVPHDAPNEPLLRNAAARNPAVALFVERALAVDRNFALTDENATFVAEICRRLDGVPLAIELAAARANVLKPQQLRDRLDERFRVLTAGSRSALPRQQTLRATIDWSYDLLDERERTLFRRLGIFVGGFRIEGAVAVYPELDDLDVFELLSSLVEKSLVLVEDAGEALRYRLLESTRLYASEKLAAAGERNAAADRHLQYLRALFAEAFEAYQRTADSSTMEKPLTDEIDDVRAALAWSLAAGDASLGGELLAMTGTTWRFLGREREAREQTEAFEAALRDAEPVLQARLRVTFASLVGQSGRIALALEAAREAVALARASGVPAVLAGALLARSRLASFAQDFGEAEPALAEAEAIPGMPAVIRIMALEARAVLSQFTGDLDTAARAFEEVATFLRGNERNRRGQVLNLAEIEHARGNTGRAIELLRDVLPGARAENNPNALAVYLANYAGYLVAADDVAAATEAVREVIREIAPGDPESPFIASSLEHLALAIALAGNAPRAARLGGYADATLRKLGFARVYTEKTTYDRLHLLLRERLPPSDAERLLAEGASLTPHDAIAEALADD